MDKAVNDHDNTVNTDNTNNTDVITKAICVMTPTEGNDVKGLISFTQNSKQ